MSADPVDVLDAILSVAESDENGMVSAESAEKMRQIAEWSADPDNLIDIDEDLRGEIEDEDGGSRPARPPPARAWASPSVLFSTSPAPSG